MATADKQTNENSTGDKNSTFAYDHLLTSFRGWLDVGNVMSRGAVTIPSDENAAAAAKIMAEKNISCVLVAEGEDIVGIITEKDFLRRALPLHKSFDRIAAKQIMSSPIHSISPNLSILDAGRIAVERCIKQLPVMRGEQLLGIVTQTDLIRALTSYGMWWDVGELMSSDVATIQDTATVSEAAQVMVRHNISCVVVLKDAEVVGVFTERDLVKRVVAAKTDPAKVRISDVMSSPVISVRRDSSLFSASTFMERLNIRRLPVMEGDKLYGIVTQTDIFRAVERKLQAEEERFLRVLIVEDVIEDAQRLQDCLSRCTRHAVATECSEDLSGALEKLGRRRFDMIFLAETLGEETTTRQALDALAEHDVHIPVIIICTRDEGNVRTEVDRPGAYDYVMKDNLTPESIEKIVIGAGERQMLQSIKNGIADTLQESEERFRQLAENIHAVFWMVSADWNRVFYISPAYEDIWGRSCRSLYDAPHSWLDSVVPADRDAVLADIEKKAAGDLSESKFPEYRINHPDGTIRWIQASAFGVRNEYGHIDRIVGIAQDITARKLMEHRLLTAKNDAETLNEKLKDATEQANQLANQAATASAAKSRFLANMSHEIRTPMNAIIGFSNVLASEDINEKQKKYVSIIQESCLSLLALIDDILDLSKIEAGQLDTENIECSIGEILDSVESLMRPKAEGKGLDFRVIEDTALPTRIRTDPTRLRQCLINLTNNALKFTKAGHVHIKIRIQKNANDTFIRFDVEDTGIGIPAESQDSIFEAFMQADETTTRRFGGTGLGLTITKQLAELLGGSLSFTSEPGRGSTFSLSIPIGIDIANQPAMDRSDSPSAAHDQPQQLQEDSELTGRILIVEDCPTNQALVRLLLEKAGYETAIAEDGEVALKEVEAAPFDLILMDIQMPNLNGYEATTELRKRGITTTIIALTANAMKGDREKCIAAGCDDYLAKPIDREKLLAMIRTYLSPTAAGAAER